MLQGFYDVPDLSKHYTYERDNLELKLTKFRKERKTKQRPIEKSKKRFE